MLVLITPKYLLTIGYQAFVQWNISIAFVSPFYLFAWIVATKKGTKKTRIYNCTRIREFINQFPKSQQGIYCGNQKILTQSVILMQTAKWEKHKVSSMGYIDTDITLKK